MSEPWIDPEIGTERTYTQSDVDARVAAAAEEMRRKAGDAIAEIAKHCPHDRIPCHAADRALVLDIPLPNAGALERHDADFLETVRSKLRIHWLKPLAWEEAMKGWVSQCSCEWKSTSCLNYPQALSAWIEHVIPAAHHDAFEAYVKQRIDEVVGSGIPLIHGKAELERHDAQVTARALEGFAQFVEANSGEHKLKDTRWIAAQARAFILNCAALGEAGKGKL